MGKRHKISEAFERDYAWYLKYRETFNFDGTGDTKEKVIFSPTGRSAKECFYMYDSMGKTEPTNEPKLLYDIHKCKGGINFNIKAWAEDRAKGWLGSLEMEEIAKEFELLPWMTEAIENQCKKLRQHDNTRTQ